MRSLFSKISRSFGVKKEERKEATTTSPSSSPRKEKLTSFLKPSSPIPITSGRSSNDVERPSRLSDVAPLTKSIRGKSKPDNSGRSVTAIFQSQSRGDAKVAEPDTTAPLLNLNLPLDASNLGASSDANGIDEFGTLFSDDTLAANRLADADIASKSLNSDEVNRLTVASSAVIRAQGLETLGLLHPHWLSASPGSQRKLIARFILALKSNNFAKFEADLRDASPQDVAPVLKWGLRHFAIEKNSFGAGNGSYPVDDQWAWYRIFAEKERVASFPMNSFSNVLLPLLPNSHGVLLKNLMELFASIAAHADANGMFNTKLSKVLAWWIISNRTWAGTGFGGFYVEWDRAARILEHVFLAYIRDQSQSQQRVPLRLKSLYQPYPPAVPPTEGLVDDKLGLGLPQKPRLTTRTFGALLVKLEAPYGRYTHERETNPVKLMEHAQETSWKTVADGEGQGGVLWESLKQEVAKGQSLKTANGTPETTGLNQADKIPSQALFSIFSDTTVRWLRLIEPLSSTTDAPSSPGPSPPASPDTQSGFRRRRSFSSPEVGLETPPGGGLQVLHEDRQLRSFEKAASASNLISEGPDGEDWDVFSSAGFGTSPNLGAENLAQSLVGPKLGGKYTSPTRKNFPSTSSKRKQAQPLSVGSARPSSDTVMIPTPRIRPSNDSYRMIAPSIIQVDEAFADTWADTLLDPSTASKWPDFGLFQLKEKHSEVEWLIIERTVAPRPKTPEPVEPENPRATSPGPSVAPSTGTSKSGRRLFGSPTKKRFSLFFSRPPNLSSESPELPQSSNSPSFVDQDAKDTKPKPTEAKGGKEAIPATYQEPTDGSPATENTKTGSPILTNPTVDVVSTALADTSDTITEREKSFETATGVSEATIGASPAGPARETREEQVTKQSSEPEKPGSREVSATTVSEPSSDLKTMGSVDTPEDTLA